MFFQFWQTNVETTLTELRRFNVDEPILFQHWNLVENESWAYVYRSCFNVEKTTLKELRRFNVDDPMLFQRWYLVETENWNSIETTLSIFFALMFTTKWLNNKTQAKTQSWFNVYMCWNNVATSVNVISTLIQCRFINAD